MIINFFYFVNSKNFIFFHYFEESIENGKKS
jgi:hypothetical protein